MMRIVLGSQGSVVDAESDYIDYIVYYVWK